MAGRETFLVVSLGRWSVVWLALLQHPHLVGSAGGDHGYRGGQLNIGGPADRVGGEYWPSATEQLSNTVCGCHTYVSPSIYHPLVVRRTAHQYILSLSVSKLI